MSQKYVPEVRVEARVRNNVLWHAIFDRFGSVAEFCRAHPEVRETEVGNLLNLKKGFNPHRSDGKWRKICLALSKIFQMLPEDLFPENLHVLEHTEMVVEIPFTALPSIDRRTFLTETVPDTSGNTIVDAELHETIRTIIGKLSAREEKVLRLRFGLDGEDEHTTEEVGKMLRVSRERIRQIEAKALRKLRHRSYTRVLLPFLD